MEFLVHGAERRGNCFHIIGRCGRYEIRVNDVFDCAYERPVVITDDEYVSEPPTAIHQVALRVESIRAYEHALPVLDPGMTAEIVVKGQGYEQLREGVMLGKRLDEFSERQRRPQRR